MLKIQKIRFDFWGQVILLLGSLLTALAVGISAMSTQVMMAVLICWRWVGSIWLIPYYTAWHRRLLYSILVLTGFMLIVGVYMHAIGNAEVLFRMPALAVPTVTLLLSGVYAVVTFRELKRAKRRVSFWDIG
jgi:hypothetical protein